MTIFPASDKQNATIILGLTGSIGMGKTTVAAMFHDEGVRVFDSDAAVHALYAGDAVPAIEAAFPGVTNGGVVDRGRLSQRVLGNAEALKRLETIVHPLVRTARQKFLAEARNDGAAIALLDIPLLFETGGEAEVDAVVVVSAPESVQKARVLARPGMTQEKFSAILSKQMPDAEKRRRADHVVGTGGSLDETRAGVKAIVSSLNAYRPEEF